MSKSKTLIKLNEKHQILVRGLIDSLRFVQLGFFHAGKFLYKIRLDKTYLSEDSSRKITFTEFCERPDLPLPGRNEASRLRIAEKLIRVYKFFIIEKGYPEKKLLNLGYSKLDMLVTVIQARPKEAEEWLEKAELLSMKDLIDEVRQKDKSLGEILECEHKNIEEITFFRCTDCNTAYKKDPRKIIHGKVK